ncbi:amylo-alpha-1,6-glucosidase [Geofilum rubicundum]|uniref:Glycogen debranching enzyme-related protein n=1 Tax=Geofilum rubicundum JCM 15548 TaxID=1236989 RepID=A0A0E9LRZ7_9BACT|nr:amylo-alpha-1,6-glucosidase [Geofilum rubicundum]GAO28019.1 glycogen debranching enzyme-related protein [Geofilum rubicundum JCM 15548]
MYEGFPYLHMQVSKDNEFLAMPDWYRDVEYTKEQHRGYPFKEDLFSPGYFEMDIEKGESLIFSAGTLPVKPNGLKAKYTRETQKRIPRNTLLNNLLNSAEQFIQRRGQRIKLLAGYHWYHERLRDTLVALPGLMAYQANRSHYLDILEHVIDQVKKIYIAESELGLRPNTQNVDVPLWVFYSIQEIEQMIPEMDICQTYGEAWWKLSSITCA